MITTFLYLAINLVSASFLAFVAYLVGVFIYGFLSYDGKDIKGNFGFANLPPEQKKTVEERRNKIKEMIVENNDQGLKIYKP